MEGVIATSAGNWAHDGEPCVQVEQVMADHEGRSAPALLVPHTRVESNRNELPLARDVLGHLPDLVPRRRPPVNLLGLVVRGNVPDELA